MGKVYTRAHNIVVRAFILSIGIFFAVVAVIFFAVTIFAFPLKYKSYIRTACSAHNMNPVLVASVIHAESNFKKNSVSPKGAIGLMQIMPSTAEFIAKKMNKANYDLYDAQTNIEMGTFYLKYLLDKFGDLKTVLIAYNAGEGNVARWLEGGAKLATSPYPETNAYVEKVLNGMNYYKLRF